MSYPAETKEQVRQRYREGMPRRQISETMGIPLRTIERWTDGIASSLSFITCPTCQKKVNVRNMRQKYCSERCKRRAYYQDKHDEDKPPQLRWCVECKKRRFKTRHSLRRYCSRKCQNKAAQRRRREQSRAEQLSE